MKGMTQFGQKKLSLGVDTSAESLKQGVKNRMLKSKLVKLTERDETGKLIGDQATLDKHISSVGTTTIDKASEKVNLGTLQPDGSYKGGTPTNVNQGGSREIYTPKGAENITSIKSKTSSTPTYTSVNPIHGGGISSTGENIFSKFSNDKTIKENYPSKTKITQDNVVSDQLKKDHQAYLDKAANKPKTVEEKPQYLSGHTSSGFTTKKGYDKTISSGKSSSGAIADIKSVTASMTQFGGKTGSTKQDYFKK